MNKFQVAADTLKRQAVKYEALIESAKALEEIGSLQQAADEASKASAKAKADLDESIKTLAASKAEIVVAKQKADDLLAKATNQALATLKEADQKAVAITASAEVNADQIVQQASVKAQQHADLLAGQIAGLTSSKLQLEQEVSGLQKAIAVKGKELDEIEGKLAKARENIAKLLG